MNDVATIQRIDTLEATRARFMELREQVGSPVEVGKVVRNILRDYTQGAFEATPAAKLTRTPFMRVYSSVGEFVKWVKVSKAPWGESQTGAGRVYGIQRALIRFHSRRGDYHRRYEKEPRRVNKGFARASWLPAMKALGMSTRKAVRKAPLSGAQVQDGEVSHGTVANWLSYIERVNGQGGIAANGLRRATQRMQQQIQLMTSRIERGVA